jgi:NAD(P)-dependent dehydrogenase (short-subunit alcohol dehydrogenase family)
MKIKNAVALVTGANRGLGLAFAKALLERGASHTS